MHASVYFELGWRIRRWCFEINVKAPPSYSIVSAISLGLLFAAAEAELGREREALRLKEAATQQRQATQATQARDQQATGERDARQRARTLAALESEIAEAEAALAQYSRQLQESGEAGAFEEVRHLADAYATAQAQLDGLMAEWTALAVE